MLQSLSGRTLLVINAGSSSLKFKVFAENSTDLVPVASGLFDRIGDLANSTLIAKISGNNGTEKAELKRPVDSHTSAVSWMLEFLSAKLSSGFEKEVAAVGHRIVHGLDESKPALLTPETLDKIQQAAVLAPLHNPPGLSGIRAALEVFKQVPQVAVFDTAFHATMPQKAFMYALPYDLYAQHRIRRYGFHGTSHQYLTQQAAAMLGKEVNAVNLITCHLGNGSSIAAVKGGQCIDTSMGMTPLEGLMMGTRCGDMDPAVVLHIQNQLHLTPKEADTLLNKKSGLLGVSGAGDLRAVIAAAAQGDPRSQLGLDMFVYRVRKYIGAYLAALEGQVDAVVFSAGIGENSSIVRGLVCEGLRGLGVEVDDAANHEAVGGKQADISAATARIKALVIPTDEELAIAQQTLAVVRA